VIKSLNNVYATKKLLMSDCYLWFKAFHIIFVIAWMAGMLYLPRLFVYHCSIEQENDAYKTFITMEKKLIKYIINPAMVGSIILGFTNAYMYGFKNLGTSFAIKMICVLGLIIIYSFLLK